MRTYITFIVCVLLMAAVSYSQSHVEQGSTNPPTPQEPPNGWYKQTSGTIQYLPKIFFLNKDTGWVGCLDGVFKTTDGGNVWTKISTQIAGRIVFVNSKLGYANADSAKYIIRTLDGGFTWEKVRIPMKEYPSEITVFGSDTVYIYSNSDKFCRSIDSCKTWEVIDISSTGGDSYFVNGSIGFACGDIESWFGNFPPSQGTEGATFEYTVDGGRTWGRRFPFIEGSQTKGVSENLRRIYAFDSSNIIAAGETQLFYSSNAGSSWSGGSPSGAFNDLCFVNSKIGYVVGYSGQIYYTSDSAHTWTPQSSTVTTRLNSVTFVDSLNGWCCGDLGIILHTLNGGKTWVKQHLPLDSLNVQAYPSPVATTLTIGYTLREPEAVTTEVLDLSGRVVHSVLPTGVESQGVHFTQISVANLSVGAYWCRVKTPRHDSMVKFTIVR